MGISTFPLVLRQRVCQIEGYIMNLYIYISWGSDNVHVMKTLSSMSMVHCETLALC